MAAPTIINGATVQLFVNGAPYAKVSSIQFGSATPFKEIRGCDSAQPYELAPTTTSIAGSMMIYRQSRDGGIEASGLTVPITEIARAKYVSLLLLETRSGTILFESARCAITSQEWTFATHALAIGTVSFLAIDYINDFRPSQ
jgi:hypothetical protein